MFHNILVLCTANICRSPLAEGLLRHKLRNHPGIQVQSAGVAALKGERAHPVVLDMLRKLHIMDMRNHRARQCDEPLLRQADLVLVMEHSHLRWLSSSYPQFQGRSFLMGHWRERAEVRDPIGEPREVFEQVCEHIDLCSDDWLAKILATNPSAGPPGPS